ncbi:flagellar export chaperone FliS [Isoptericola sp. NEAU-Y5]|uniref:Flagellar secretion chaperone FliS n=1 Tax=Isoptericola luteus TaxID=2879484 RepID=A0ABS7ZJD3_9MICO|nr:flagellar export chaperone FliS [Isoptericola sp. NEAU-Y5]MCA5895140.1 flagellar export chaperone FliS [Isoptericola sp. NEAU-Y5]
MTHIAQSAYGRDAVLTASPARLLTMLYDRLVLDLRRAQAAQAEERWSAASTQLVHAQAIVAELMGSLDRTAWDGAEDLLALYVYVHEALVAANVGRDVARTAEALELVLPLQEAWQQAADQLPAAAGASLVGGVSGVA